MGGAGVTCRECKRTAGTNPDCHACLGYGRPTAPPAPDLSKPVMHWAASTNNT